MLYAKRERPDSSTPLFDIATPAEIAAAHPKCGSCEHVHETKNRAGVTISYCEREDAVQYYCPAVNPTTDYCPHHSELTK